MTNHQPVDLARALEARLANETDDLRRNLMGVIHEANAALDRMAKGLRPSTSLSGTILGHAADRANEAAVKVDLLLTYCGEKDGLIPADRAVAIIKGDPQ